MPHDTGGARTPQKARTEAIIRSERERFREAGLDPFVIERSGREGLVHAVVPSIYKIDGADGLERNLVTFAITTDEIDRMNERMDPTGIQLHHYFTNPVVLWSHDNSIPAIGRGVEPRMAILEDGRNAVLMGVQFSRITKLSVEINDLVAAGFLNTGSIGFIPLDYLEQPLADFPGAYPSPSTVRTFTRWELLEYSICNIPMNPGSTIQRSLIGSDAAFETKLVEACAKGIIPADAEIIRRTMGRERIELPPKPEQPADLTTLVRALVANASTDPHLLSMLAPRQTPVVERGIGPHSYGCLMLRFPSNVAAEVLSLGENVADADLAPDGRESDPHITLCYGLHTEDADVIEAVVGKLAPITVTLGEISTFDGPGQSGPSDAYAEPSHEVVKIDVASPELVSANRIVRDTLKVTSSHDDYNPHVTLAYVKAGRGRAYAGSTRMTGRELTFTEVVYSAPDGTETVIALAGSSTKHHPSSTMPTSILEKADPAAAPPAAPANPAPVPAPVPTPASPAPEPQVAPEGQPTTIEGDPSQAPNGPAFDVAWLDVMGEHAAVMQTLTVLPDGKSENDAVKRLAAQFSEQLAAFIAEVNDLTVTAKEELAAAQAEAAEAAAAEAPPAPDPAAPPAPVAAPVAPAPVTMAYESGVFVGFVPEAKGWTIWAQKVGRVFSKRNLQWMQDARAHNRQATRLLTKLIALASDGRLDEGDLQDLAEEVGGKSIITSGPVMMPEGKDLQSFVRDVVRELLEEMVETVTPEALLESTDEGYDEILMALDPETGETVYVSAKDVELPEIEPTADATTPATNAPEHSAA